MSQLEVVPAQKREAVVRALQSTFGRPEIESISLLAGGFSSALVYRISVAGAFYVLRVVVKSMKLLDPVLQYQCLEAAAAGGVAPRVLYSSAADNVAISDFVAVKPFGGSSPLSSLVPAVRRLHALPGFPFIVNYLDAVVGMVDQFQASGVLPESAVSEHMLLFDELQAGYPRDRRDEMVASHNDLNPNNILFDGERVWFVDWDSACLNDRYADLANIANTFLRSEDQETAFLTEYFGHPPSDYQRARFFLMKQVVHVFYAVNFFRIAQAALPPGQTVDASMDVPRMRDFYGMLMSGQVDIASPEGQLLFGKVALNEALAGMKSPRFKNSLSLVRTGKGGNIAVPPLPH